MLERINPYAPHIVTGIGIALYYLGVPYGGLICYIGFILTGIYYLLIELKTKSSAPRYFRLVLITIPTLIILLVGQWFVWGDNTFMMIVLLIIMYSFIKVKVDKKYHERERT
jgi:hypothetical protein